MEKRQSPGTRREKQVIQHTYGSSDDYSDDESDATLSKGKGKEKAGSKCKCGSTLPKYISHRKCPLNKKSRTTAVFCETSSDTGNEESEDEYRAGLCMCNLLRGYQSATLPTKSQKLFNPLIFLLNVYINDSNPCYLFLIECYSCLPLTSSVVNLWIFSNGTVRVYCPVEVCTYYALFTVTRSLFL